MRPARLLHTLLAGGSVVLAVTPAHADAASWARPVTGGVNRGFAYRSSEPFRRGWHRGIDLAAAPGSPVRAACAGNVTAAARLPGADRVVTLACGRWRVTALPLAWVAVRRGATVRRGALLGTLAASRDHDGLHLGVRRAGDPFGYVDPAPFLTRRRPHVAPPVVPRPRRRTPWAPREALPAPVTAVAPLPGVATSTAPSSRATTAPSYGAIGARRDPARRRVTRPAHAATADAGVPALAWAGLALALSGVVSGVSWRWRLGRRPTRGAAAARA